MNLIPLHGWKPLHGQMFCSQNLALEILRTSCFELMLVSNSQFLASRELGGSAGEYQTLEQDV